MTETILTPLLQRPISTLDEAKAWIQELQDKDLSFHFDDSASTIGNMIDGQWVPLFSKSESAIVQARVNELYNPSFDWQPYDCPIGYALHVMGHIIERD